MFLITSAAYVTSGLATEYGKIPPAFLPLQNKRLFEHQLKLVAKENTIVLSLPSSYTIHEKDAKILDTSNVEVVRVPEGLTLGQSVIYVLNVIAKYNEPLSVLHGDTLFNSIPIKKDSYLIAKPTDYYEWASSIEFESEEFVYAGYFNFSNQSLLIKSITESNYEFITGILKYKQHQKVEECISESWFDFGHANTYYRSKTKLTTQRFFNDLKIDGYSVKKSSKNINKILAEANWFNSVPNILKRYIPSVWDSGQDGEKGYYQIEYFYLSSLAELFVYGKNELFIWRNIINACNEFIIDCMRFRAPKQINIDVLSRKLYKDKTYLRLDCYAKYSKIDLNVEWIFNGIRTPSINQIVEEMISSISNTKVEHQTIIHGDFCFSNILYNFRTNSIKVIDPRGIDALDNHNIYGDIRYDIAKLAHSIIGMYDFIIADYFTYNEIEKYNIEFSVNTTNTINNVQTYFLKSRLGGMNVKESCMYPIMVLLFLSMLPLHKDNEIRQKAMLANALRLYLDFKLKYQK